VLHVKVIVMCCVNVIIIIIIIVTIIIMKSCMFCVMCSRVVSGVIV